MAALDRAAELAVVRGDVMATLGAAHDAREAGLTGCRQTIRACSRAIRMVHRREYQQALEVANEAESSLRKAQTAMRPHPKVAYAGFLQDAEKEYAEAMLLKAFVQGEPLLGYRELDIEPSAWLNGLAEAASELRRFLLDELRRGDFSRGDKLLEDMDDVYELLVGIDFPDGVTGGLRRTTDAFRAVLERTRSDYTTTVMQEQLRHAIEAASASN